MTDLKLVKNESISDYKKRKNILSDFDKSKGAPEVKAVQLSRNPLEILTKVKSEKYFGYRVLWRYASEQKITPVFPLQVDIDISDSCNLCCRMCPQKADPGFSSNLMGLDTQKIILDQARSLGVFSVNFGVNTEPLINKSHFIDSMRLFKEYGFVDSFIHTNGTLFDVDTVNAILDAGIGTVCVSLSLCEDESHVSRAFEGVCLLREARERSGSLLPFIRVSVIPVGTNKEQVKRALVLFGPVCDYFEYAHLVDYTGLVSSCSGMKSLPMVCSDPWKRLYVSCDGGIHLCCGFVCASGHMFLGNVKAVSLGDVWSNYRAVDLRRRVSEGREYSCERNCLSRFYEYTEGL